MVQEVQDSETNNVTGKNLCQDGYVQPRDLRSPTAIKAVCSAHHPGIRGAPVGSRVLEGVAVLRVQDAGLAGPQRRAVEDAVELDLVPLLRVAQHRAVTHAAQQSWFQHVTKEAKGGA